MKAAQTTPLFTVKQIKDAHAKVKSGADFPGYVREIIALGVTGFETFVADSHTDYFGADGFKTSSQPMYDELTIAGNCDVALFTQHLKAHQQGQSDYLTFCRQCAETGVDRWVVDMAALTCVYYDKAGNEVLVERIPV